jgi:D-psicose/D-tagatose/L-ribulose 3-epimerase
MKFGAHSFIFTQYWTDESLGILEQAKALGLNCFEIGVGDDIVFDPRLTRQAAETLGLELFISPGGLWPLDCDLSLADAGTRKKGLLWHQKQVDLAHAMGATAYTGALYGHPGTVQRRKPRPDELDWTAEGLAVLAEYAQARGVCIVIEPMSHFRTHLVNRPEQAVDLLERAGHDNLSILLDTYHMVCEVRDYGTAIRRCAPRMWGLHACENDRGVPGGGLVPWAQVFSALRETGFDGNILMESYNSSLPGFAEGRAMLHDVCPDGADFVRRGLVFLTEPNNFLK